MKKIIRRFLCAAIAVLSLFIIAVPSSVVVAEDIDLFTGTTSTPQNPNVLIIVDSSASWNSNAQHWPGGKKQGESELKALSKVIGLLGSNVNVGLMMLASGTGSSPIPGVGNNREGGYIRYAVRPMNTDNKKAFQQMMGVNPDGTVHPACAGLGPSDTPPTVYIPVATTAPWGQAQTPGGAGVPLSRGCIYQFFNKTAEQVGTNADWSGALFDAFKYFGGGTDNTIHNPLGLGPDRYSGNPDPKCDPAAYVNGASDSLKQVHKPPIDAANNCAKNYIIFIGNGFPNQDAPASLLTAVGGDTTILPVRQFVTTDTNSETTLGTNTVCESNAACVTRAGTIAPGEYDSYTCTGGTQSSVATQTNNSCVSVATCQTQAQTTFPSPTYNAWACTGGSNGSTVNLGADNICETNAQCVTRASGVTAGLSPYTCTGGSATIGSTITLVASTGSVCETPAACATRIGALPGNAGYTVTCSGGTNNPPACTGSNRINQVATATTCKAGSLYGQTMQGTSGSCAAPNLVGQLMTATPTAPVCNGANFVNQTMKGFKLVKTVTPSVGDAPPGNKNRYADEWTKFMFGNDVNAAAGKQSIKTYTIDVFKDAQDADATALLYNMAAYGGGSYYTANSESGIEDVIAKILVDIQAENSVFAAAALPVSATNRAQNENQVFFGMFRPDESGLPRWHGNLKRYQIVLDSASNTILGDKNRNNALSSSGFFGPCAESFWTTDSGSYWAFSAAAAGQCTTIAGSANSDLPDGGLVEKGGAAEVLRKGNNPPTTDTTPTYDVNRNMYTCASSASCPAAVTSGLVTFDTTNVSTAALGAVDATERDRIVNYTLGQDVGQNGALVGEKVDQVRTKTRPSIHGDVVHSRPLPVNYAGSGSYQSNGVVVYYGANDGTLHAVQTSNGKELWSFVAPEHHAKLKRLTLNSPVIEYPNLPVITPAPTKKDYFFDGTMGLYQNADNSKVGLYASMRRGGRMLYGFDITNPNAPVLKWRFGCPNLDNDTGCTAGASGIGQTWSAPNVAFLKGYSTTEPVLIVGGGYDKCWDQDVAVPSSPNCNGSKGNKIYVINAITGALVKTFDTDRSVPADVALVERNGDGSVDHAYVGDLGGNLYRVDFVDPAAPATLLASTGWQIKKIAEVTSGAGRRFIFAPAVLPFQGRVFVTLGSGDRERPLISNYPYTTGGTGVTNRFYALMDTFPTSGGAIDLDGSDLGDVTSTPLTASQCLSPTSTVKGWRTDMVGGRGEQVVTSSLITEGSVFFNTNRPIPDAPGICDANLGEARGYKVDLFCGKRTTVKYDGGGLPISPVQGTTVACDSAGGNCRTVTFCIGCATDENKVSQSQFSPGKVVPVISARRTRLFWHSHTNR
jgi:Tfp pilus tip-associated adhesin PilY1